MARYIIRHSYVDIVGGIWMPYGAVCSMRMRLSQHDIDDMRDADGKITRESVDRWVSVNSGDFSSLKDWRASIEDGNTTIDLPFTSEDGELAYLDTLAEEENV